MGWLSYPSGRSAHLPERLYNPVEWTPGPSPTQHVCPQGIAAARLFHLGASVQTVWEVLEARIRVEPDE